MALFTGSFFVAQVSLIIVAKPFYAIFCSLIIVAKPFYAIFCTSVYITSQKPGLRYALHRMLTPKLAAAY